MLWTECSYIDNWPGCALMKEPCLANLDACAPAASHSGCDNCDGSCGCHDDSPMATFTPPVTCAMIVALGENDLAIPCLMFATVVEAEKFLTDRFGAVSRADRWLVGGDANMRERAEDFFLDYYDGCGGIYSFMVCEVKYGQPIIAFDLD